MLLKLKYVERISFMRYLNIVMKFVFLFKYLMITMFKYLLDNFLILIYNFFKDKCHFRTFSFYRSFLAIKNEFKEGYINKVSEYPFKRNKNVL